MIAENLAVIRKLIPLDTVSLIAVTKTQSPEVIRQAFAAGLSIVGENRVQEAMEKSALLADLPLTWHLIGHLQTNKVKQAVQLFSLIHSVDSSRLATEINRCALNIGKVQDVLLEVNVSGEDAKSGVTPEQAEELAAFIDSLPNLRLCGMMTVAPLFDDPELTRPIFRTLREMFDKLKEKALHPDSFRWLSMGMTHDYRVAVEEGSTMVRIGTGLFGARSAR